MTRNGSGTPQSVASRAQVWRMVEHQSGPLEKGLARIQSSASAIPAGNSPPVCSWFLLSLSSRLTTSSSGSFGINQVLVECGLQLVIIPDQVWETFLKCSPPFHCEVTTNIQYGGGGGGVAATS